MGRDEARRGEDGKVRLDEEEEEEEEDTTSSDASPDALGDVSRMNLELIIKIAKFV